MRQRASANVVLLICPTGCPAIFVSSPCAKDFSFFSLVETAIEPIHPAPTKGRFAIVTEVGRDAVDADGAADERREADGEVVWS